MWSMSLPEVGAALVRVEGPTPAPGPGEVRLKVLACGVCRTDLHVIDGDLPPVRSPITPGHEIVGVVEAHGEAVSEPAIGARVGVGWLGRTCGTCPYCLSGRENLCDAPAFTGYSRNGGFATHVLADARFVYPLASERPAAQFAPLLCAGLIGWRSLVLAGDARRIGLYGFGAAAHIIAQVARWQGRRVFAFTRPGDAAAQAFARGLGAEWAGDSDAAPPEPLDAAIIYAAVGDLVPAALRAVGKGGRVVCGGIHMSDIPGFAYEILWGERSLASVANLTRQDARDFLSVVEQAPISTHVTVYPLSQANAAIADLRAGRVQGAAVLVPDDRGRDEEASATSDVIP
jgi:propanol-preferring alcohol dehydrogenase